MLCNKGYEKLNKKKEKRKTDLKGTEIKFQSFVHKVQSCFETFCMSDFSRFLNSVNLYHTVMYNCNKKRHYCNYVRI